MIHLATLLLCVVSLYAGEAGKRMTHIEVTSGPPTVTTYRYDDGSATAEISDWSTKLLQRRRVDIAKAPTSDAGWAMCAQLFGLSVYHKPGLLLWNNRTDQPKQLDIDGSYGAIVPANSWILSVGPPTVDLVKARPTMHAKAPDYVQHEQGPVAWIGDAAP
jgi:hypothetical protein